MSAEIVTSPFVFATCQLGAEQALKNEFARDERDVRFAYSRPGFVSFKSTGEPFSFRSQPVRTLFARTQAMALGKVEGERLNELASRVWSLVESRKLLAGHAIGDLHVWQRDWAKPGWRGFRPGASRLAEEAESAIRHAAPIEVVRSQPRRVGSPSPRGATILDVVLVETGEWWVGSHRADSWPSRWRGGVFPVETPPHAISRAYGKMAEALAWSRMPIADGDTLLELGSAPGGAAQALLARGLRVVGVDPAEVDHELRGEPNFAHIRRCAAAVPRKSLRGVRWLAADMNVAPQYTLDAVESMIGCCETPLRGLILTLKLPNWKLADELPDYLCRVRNWGYHDVRARQLALAGQEVCVAALRSRSQRRTRRS